MRAFPLAASAAAMLLAACSDPGACSLSIEPAITVRAIDAETGENVTDLAHGTVSEGVFVDSLRPAGVDEAQRVVLLRAADERAGRYDVFVERPGYQAVSLSGILAAAGDCHVETVALDVTMTRIP